MKCEKNKTAVYAPGTVIERKRGETSVFAQFDKMIEMTCGLSLGQVCAMTGLEPSSVQNWVKRGFVSHPVNKKYFGRQLARIMLINALRDSMKIENVGLLMQSVNGDADDESDDIISEEKFYDYLCEAFDKCENGLFGPDIRKTVSDIIADYDPGTPEAKERLTEALCAMVYAYASGLLTKKANEHFDKLTKGE